MLSHEQIESFWNQGYLRIENVFDADHVEGMRADLDWMIDTWAERSVGWTGPWRKAYMDEQTEAKSQLIAMHDLYWYAASWMRCVTHPRLCDAIADLLGGTAELHHSTMHVKPPETGHPFPMHQDAAFYLHEDDRYIDVLVHLDDTQHENGEIRFVAGSHKQGFLRHITESDGKPCTPHLPTHEYRLEDTVAVPARAGDVVLFNIFTIHGSHINQTDRMRRMVRLGYRHPENRQISGQSVDRPGLMARGRRERVNGHPLYSTCGPVAETSNELAGLPGKT